MNWLLVLALLQAPAAVRDSVRAEPGPDATIGIALSGGGAKGFAHIGVLRVLEGAGVPIDAIAGTSMGGLVGGLYAIGYTPDMLEQLAVEQDWEALLTDSYDRRSWTIESKLAREYLLELPIRGQRPELPTGLVAGQRISQLFADLTWPVHPVHDFRAFPIPFVTLATDLETGAAVPLDTGFLPQAMRASISIPTVFAPVRIGDRLLVDGGLSRNLPAQDVGKLGADIIICVDVSAPLATADSIRTLLDVLDQAISFRATASTEEQRKLCDVVIEPDIEDLSALSFDRATEWIARGDSAARKALPQILAVTGEARARGTRRAPLVQIDSTYIDELVLEGLQRASSHSVARALDLEVPGWVTRDEVDKALGEIYSSGLFAGVTYRLDAVQRGDSVVSILAVRFQEETRDRLGFSFRYETRYKASILTSVILHNLLQYGSVTRLNLRLGQQIQLGGQYFRRSGPGNAVSLGASAEWSEAPLDLFEEGRRVAELQVDVVNLSGFVGMALGNTALAGVLVKGEYAHNRASIAADTFDEKDTFYSVAALVRADTYDRDAFPTRGFGLLLKSEWADRSLGSGGTFSQNVLDAALYVPVHRHASLTLRATLGNSSGDDLPTHYLFFLGGSSPYFIFPDRQFPFLGLEPHERRGRNLESFQLGLQVRFAQRFFAVLSANAGDTPDRLDFDLQRYVTGYGLTLGMRTPFGPITATIAETTLERWPDLSVDLGYRF
jgi:NTE family protein